MSSNNETILNGRYRLVAQQGSGGMAVIYRATDMSLGRTVAVKILRPSLITNDATFLNRFRDEARAIANLSHPNIVTVHDVGDDGQTHYIVMEYVEGQDLKKIIRTETVLSVKRTLDLAIQICDGIGFAHRAGLVHADVKPQNILITVDDRVKVTDFGIAQVLTDTQPLQRQEVVWGSPHYFSPEQARGEKPTPASDVYSIGIVIFEMLTGRLPYTGANQQELALAHLRDRVPLATEFNPSVPENLARIVYKVMSKEPSMRYRLADQLGQVLKSYRDRSQQHTAVGFSTSNPPSMSHSAPLPPPPPSASRPLPNPSQSPSASRPLASPQRPAFGGSSRNAPASQESSERSRPFITQRHASTGPSQTVQHAQGNSTRQAEPQFRAIDSPLQPGQQYEESHRLRSRPLESTEYRASAVSSLDMVTIGLALVAFFAVACLIPLYIAVLQAYSG
ncbi:MAG: protein kinase [Anaerolineae bacterium]|nr:protein kinase [Anaerolineae bacterium]